MKLRHSEPKCPSLIAASTPNHVLPPSAIQGTCLALDWILESQGLNYEPVLEKLGDVGLGWGFEDLASRPKPTEGSNIPFLRNLL